MSPQQIIQDMDSYVATFFALEVGDFSGVQDSDLRKALRRLHLLNAPSSTYAFLFNLFRDQSRGEEATVERGGSAKDA